MSGFIVIAGLLTLATLAALLYPLLRKNAASPQAWPIATTLIVVVLVGGAALYPAWSNFEWDVEEPGLDSPQAMVGRLARRLERNPDDLAGWKLLGRSYYVIGQYELSARAYHRAETLSGGKDADALIGQAESLFEVDGQDLAGRAGRLFERAMEADPTSVKALFFSAFAARERNELDLARQRFMRLLEANPPEAVVRIITEQLQEIDVMARMLPQAPVAGSGAAAMAAAAPDAQGGDAATAVSVPLRVTLSPSVAAQAADGAPLFVVARIPGQRGAPLAAKRLDARFPQDVELLSTDAMLVGTGFTTGQELEIEARIANGGGAISRSGDPFGTVRVKAGGNTRTAVEINQLKP